MMMKNVWTALALMATTVGMAQESRLSGGLELAFPMGDYGKAAGIGFGVSLGYEIPVNDNIGMVYHLGYINFSGKDVEIANAAGQITKTKGSSQGVIPIQAGLKYYFTDNQEGAYAGLLLGMHMAFVKVPEVDAVTFAITEKTETQVNFSLAPMLGYMVTENVDVSLRYQMIFSSTEEVDMVTFETNKKTVNNSYLGLRIAYMFGRA